MNPIQPLIRILTWFTASVSVLAPAVGQIGPVDGAPAAAQGSGDAAVVPGMRYLDPELGFEIIVPKSWRCDHTSIPALDGAEGIFRGVSPDLSCTLEIFAYTGQRVSDFDRWCAGYTERLRRRPGAKEVGVRTCAAGLRPATRLMLRYREEEQALAAEHLLVLADPMTVLALVTTGGPGRDSAIVAGWTDSLTASLRFARDPVDPMQVDAALQRGRRLLGVLRQHGRDATIDDSAAYYRMLQDGRPLGYMARRLARVQRDSGNQLRPGVLVDGLQLLEQTWQFFEHGDTRHVALDAFTSFDGRTELLEERTIQILAAREAGARPLIKLEQCIREGDQLVASQSLNTQSALPTPRPPLTVDANYLPRAWVALLPGLLAEVADEPHLFTCYDAGRRSLRPLQLTAFGPQEITSAGVAQVVYRFELLDSFGGPKAMLLTAQNGRLVRQESGSFVLELSTEAKIKDEFGAPQAQAEKRLYNAAGEKGAEAADKPSP